MYEFNMWLNLSVGIKLIMIYNILTDLLDQILILYMHGHQTVFYLMGQMYHHFEHKYNQNGLQDIFLRFRHLT